MLRYLLGNLNDFTIDKLSVDYNDLWPQDKYMLHLLYQFEIQVMWKNLFHPVEISIISYGITHV